MELSKSRCHRRVVVILEIQLAVPYLGGLGASPSASRAAGGLLWRVLFLSFFAAAPAVTPASSPK